MNAIQQLISEHMDIWTGADTGKRSGRGRASGNAGSVYGVKKLRELILELAVRGKLVQQDANDEPASELLKRIQAQKTKSLAATAEVEKPFDLPIGWEWVSFGEIAQHNSGKTLDKGRNKGVLRDYITTSNLYWGVFELDSVKQMPIEESELERCTAQKGDLLICEGGEAGRAAVWNFDKEVCFQNHVHRARLYEGISPFYAYRYFEKLNASGEIEQYRKGVGISNMSGKALSSVVFSLPPLAEQHRIVTKVDELMELCDQLEAQHSNASEAHEKLISHLLGTLTQSQSADDFNANWQRIVAHFDTLFTTEVSIDALKQTLLQLAVMGKLVPQDANDEPASELLKRIQAEKAKLVTEGKIKKDKPLAAVGDDEKLFELPKSWEWTRLGVIAQKLTDGSHNPPKDAGSGLPMLSSQNINLGKIDFNSPSRFVTEEDFGIENSRTKIESNDVLLTIVGSLGRSAVVPNNAPKFVLQRSVAVIKTELFSEFLCLQLSSPFSANYFNLHGKGTAQKGIYLGQLSEMPIVIPSIAEQYRIVTKVDALMALCEQLKTLIQQSNKQQQAIANVLVAQVLN